MLIIKDKTNNSKLYLSTFEGGDYVKQDNADYQFELLNDEITNVNTKAETLLTKDEMKTALEDIKTKLNNLKESIN